MTSKKHLIAALACISLASCAGGGSQEAANVAPKLVGIKDFQCLVNQRVDFLDGIAALDKEDGDLTPKLDIELSPSVEVVDGYATFDKVGDYVATYKVTDSAGRTTLKKANIEVVERESYTDFALPQGFHADTKGKAVFDNVGMKDGRFLVKAHGHEVAEDVTISREFTLKTNVQYTFFYQIDFRCAGKVKALADGIACSEQTVEAGEQTLSFKHIVLDSEKETRDVTIALALGGIDGPVDLTILGLKTENPQATTVTDLTEGFNFKDKLDPRFDRGSVGTVNSEDNNQTAVLRVTTPCPNEGDLWAGGMFVNPGFALKAGSTYNVSFDLEMKDAKPCEIQILPDKWADKDHAYHVFYSVETSHYVAEFVVPDDNLGNLWIYIMSGTSVNTIKMRNLKVSETLAPINRQFVAIEDYKEFHVDSHPATFSSTYGSYTYKVESFGTVDSEAVVTSPAFYVSGSGSNYVLSFVASVKDADGPIEAVVAAPVAGGWEPTILWTKITLSEEPTPFSFPMHGPGADRDYTIVWQYGGTTNASVSPKEGKKEMVIEVEDVAIDYRHPELD